MAGNKTINIEEAWELLFDKYNIVKRVEDDGSYLITSTEINEFKEARLMAKFDSSAQLPRVFKDAKLSILPETRGTYRIGHYKTHQDVVYEDIKPEYVAPPPLESLDHTNLYSEASALSFAFNSGIITDFLEADEINYTVNGRMASGEFDYDVTDLKRGYKHQLQVKNAQIEIDGGYETRNEFCIIEAKNIQADELLIRQLYFPYRLWESKINKAVVPVFMTFSNDVFHVFRYEFEDVRDYNSLTLSKYKSYTYIDETITLAEIIELFKAIKVTQEPRITFPQANSFPRIVDLLSILYSRILTFDGVTTTYGFNVRQTKYYIDACRYLGLVQGGKDGKGERVFSLTKEGQRIMSLNHKAKYLAIIQKVLEKPVFHYVFNEYLKHNSPVSKTEIASIMQTQGIPLNNVTTWRRSDTVRAWIDWIISQGE